MKTGFTIDECINEVKQKLNIPKDWVNNEQIEYAIGLLIINLSDKKDFKIHPKLLPKIIEEAERIAVNSKSNKTTLSPLELGFSINNLLLSNKYLEEIIEDVENVRLEIFGIPNPPFKNNFAKAINWLKEEEKKKTTPDFESKKKEFKKTMDKLGNIAKEYYSKYFIPGREIKIRYKNLHVEIPGNNNYVERISVLGNENLYLIADISNKISKKIGFIKSTITLYILTGTEPILPKVRYNINFEGGKAPYIVEFYDPDLSYNDMKKIYNIYKENSKRRNSHSLKKSDYIFMNIIKDLGGPPKANNKWEGTAEELWKVISKKYNSHQENVSNKLTNWKSARNKYRKINKRLENLKLDNLNNF